MLDINTLSHQIVFAFKCFTVYYIVVNILCIIEYKRMIGDEKLTHDDHITNFIFFSLFGFLMIQMAGWAAMFESADYHYKSFDEGMSEDDYEDNHRPEDY